MNAHQRRIARRLYERAFGDHVDYMVRISLLGHTDGHYDYSDGEHEYGYCQDCGAYIDEDTYYVTGAGDVFCRDCGRAEDERQEEMDDEDGFDFYGTGEDIIEGEEYGRYIGSGSENSATE